MRGRAAWVMFIVAIIFGLVLSFPYLRGGSRIPVSGGPHTWVLVTHVVTAAVALMAGPAQFVPAIRRRRALHRVIGRGYLLTGVLPAGLTAIPVALWSGHLLTQVSLTVAAVLWLVTGALAYRAARRHDVAAHRAWMTRNYALTFLAVTSRVLVPLLLLAWIPLGGPGIGSIGAQAPTMIPIGQTLGWLVNLAVAERLIRRGRRARARSDNQLAY
ncbi:DUF2306 domain-containing protein [Dactylosporangium aurantiacum]|uniref:DUF2306 domain-containing protein n=1 Tax=Dactylosporangium aurantiacum TaxID=35754 RepID=A0A9Q9MIM2_9ACTN|nr:DUF2306 domain-containing protein [Dactylosporangium aurantiacum]MDG6109930.1 DUF2306 domain-containing protein [Dactylosporangium aurantiacum]UWZ58074.1 DUF2306 domain-containing protein [Dactylosporangium aurantiacum]